MEKFGIFELLDTLSAILGDGTEPPPAEEKAEPKAVDEAFLPPDYTGGPAAGGDAISSFLARHDETVRRIGKKKE